MKYVRQLAANRGTILLVGTKRQAREIVAEEAQRAGMPFVDHRWLGGMLTNFKTVKAVDQAAEGPRAMSTDGTFERMTKREALSLQRELDEARRRPGRHQGHDRAARTRCSSSTSAIHKIAVTEAKKLGIPIVGVVDTNHSPDGIAHVIPGNDDSSRAIRLYARGVADAVLEGRSQSITGDRAGRRRVRRGRRTRRRAVMARGLGHASSETRHGASRTPAGLRAHSEEQRDGGNFREHGDGAAPAHRAGHDGMQEGAHRSRRRHERRPRSCLRIKSGAKASKAAGRVAAEGVIGAVRRAGRAGPARSSR